MSLSFNGNNNLPPAVSDYTQYEMQKLWNMVLTNVESLKEIKLILELETKNCLLPTNKDTPRPSEDNGGQDDDEDKNEILEEEAQNRNIRCIVPMIGTEFNKIRGQTMKIGEIIQYYNKWINSLYSSVLVNKGKLKKNKKLMYHIKQAYCVCDTLNTIVDRHLKKQD